MSVRALSMACLGAAMAWLAAEGPSPTDKDALFEQAARLSRSCRGHAVLVMHEGRVVFEDYADGWNADRAHPLASGTKSFTGVAAVLAQQRGLLSLDERVSDTLEEWKDDPRKSRITVRQLLDLSSGLQPDSPDGNRRVRAAAGKGDPRERIRALLSGREDFFGQGVDAPAEQEPGEMFRYGANHFFAFGEFLERRLKQRGETPSSVWAWYEANLFQPIGLQVARMGRDKAGQPQLAGGCSLTAREWAKFGELVRRQGAWPGPGGGTVQVVQADALARCFERSAANPAYGLTWWLAGDAPQPTVRLAAGLGNQRLYVIPEAKLVVVRFADLQSERGTFSDEAFLAPILQAVDAKPIAMRAPNAGLHVSGRALARRGESATVDHEPATTEPGMRLVFEEGFDTDGPPHPSRWTHETGFVRNEELQWYRPENACCKNGLLVIQATRERVRNPNFIAGSADWRTNREFAAYASASLTTKGRWTWRYGRVRMRARFDTGPGLWPAFWSVGHARPWPGCGEIDILESFRGLLLANAAWASDTPGKARWKDSRTPLEKLAQEGDFADVAAWSRAFHEWQFDWSEQRMEFRVDGRLLNTVDLSESVNATPDHANPLREPQAFIVNLAIGGISGGDPSKTEFPARFEVDWIRVWQRPEDAAHDGH